MNSTSPSSPILFPRPRHHPESNKSCLVLDPHMTPAPARSCVNGDHSHTALFFLNPWTQCQEEVHPSFLLRSLCLFLVSYTEVDLRSELKLLEGRLSPRMTCECAFSSLSLPNVGITSILEIVLPGLVGVFPPQIATVWCMVSDAH